MFTNSQVSVLQILQAQPRHVATVEHLKSVLGDEISMTISHLNNIGYACYTWQNDRPDHVMLTPEGFNALEGHLQLPEELRAERADQKRKDTLVQASQDKWRRKDARRSWIQWTITTILSIASFFAGAITEELTGFIEFIASLFH